MSEIPKEYVDNFGSYAGEIYRMVQAGEARVTFHENSPAQFQLLRQLSYGELTRYGLSALGMAGVLRSADDDGNLSEEFLDPDQYLFPQIPMKE